MTLILIDDDELVRTTWLAAAARHGHRLLALADAAELDDHDVDPSTPVFVDLCLADGASGLEVAERLHGAGFEGIFLATGARRIKSQVVPEYIKGIVGKEYPLSEAR